MTALEGLSQDRPPTQRYPAVDWQSGRTNCRTARTVECLRASSPRGPVNPESLSSCPHATHRCAQACTRKYPDSVLSCALGSRLHHGLVIADKAHWFRYRKVESHPMYAAGCSMTFRVNRHAPTPLRALGQSQQEL